MIVKDLWQQYVDKAYVGIDLSENQYSQLEKAFYAAVFSIAMMQKIFLQEIQAIPEGMRSKLINRFMNEIEKEAKEFIVCKINENLARRN